jgi:hypothetical protein
MSGHLEAQEKPELGKTGAPAAHEDQDLLEKRKKIEDDVETVLDAASETALGTARRVRKIQQRASEQWDALRRGPEGRIAA